MSKSLGDGIALLVASLLLFNVYRWVHLLPGDLLRSIVVLVATLAGAGCLALGIYRLYRKREP